MIHMTPFLFHCSSTGWALGDQDCWVNVFRDPSASHTIQTSHPIGLEVASPKCWLSVEVSNEDVLGCREEKFLRKKMGQKY